MFYDFTAWHVDIDIEEINFIICNIYIWIYVIIDKYYGEKQHRFSKQSEKPYDAILNMEAIEGFSKKVTFETNWG